MVLISSRGHFISKLIKCALLWSMCTTCTFFRFSSAAALFSLLLYVICWNCSVHKIELLNWKSNCTYKILIFWVRFTFKNNPTFFNSGIWFNCLKCRFTVMVACCYIVIKLNAETSDSLVIETQTFASCIMGKFIYFNVNVSTVLHSYILTEGNQQSL